MHKCLCLGLMCALSSGCLWVREQAYTYDVPTGVYKAVYHDLRSIPEKDKGPDKTKMDDWQDLKAALSKTDEYAADKNIKILSKKLFQEGRTLSAKAEYQVQCPTCFSDLADLLKTLYSDGEWQIFNDEIFLIVPLRLGLSATNGKLIKTAQNNIVVWPTNTQVFAFTVMDKRSQGVSLLNDYINDLDLQPIP